MKNNGEYNKIGFLYFGRLDKEKGFDAIIIALEFFLSKSIVLDCSKKVLPFKIFIFGKGLYEDRIKEIASKSKDIHYFGFQPLKKIYQYVSNCNYTLMPSYFLETFGLSAVNSLSWGLPVVGYKKGGLNRFIFDQLDLYNMGGIDASYSIIKMIELLIVNTSLEPNIANDLGKLHKNMFYEKSIVLAEEFTQVSWEKNFKNLLKEININIEKVLLVSDFVSKLGGIETYIHDVKAILKSMGSDVGMLGMYMYNNFLGKLFKYFGIVFLSFFNLFFGILLLYKIIFFRPQLIWFNSMLRWMGWFPIFISKFSKSKKIFMIHDFGYFHPFPSNIYEEKDFHYPLTLKNFIKSAKLKFKRYNIKKYIYLVGIFLKYINVFFIKYFSRIVIDCYIVPSEYMVDIIHKSYGVSKSKIKVLPHFFQS